MANPTTSTVTFSILSPDASLSYDRIKLRLEEYRTLLASGSDTIELATENGKTVICRKQANEMEEYLAEAEILLQNVIQSRDISTLIVLHHLRDLSKVLDNLKLYDECRLTGNCALDLAEALGRRSLEFRREQAETLALVAELTVYQPRARALFIQAVSIGEEVVANDASNSNKIAFLNVLGLAGYRSSGHLSVQWLERAVQLMTKELPPTMVDPEFRSVTYYNYGVCLYGLKQYSNALEAYHESISIRRTSFNYNLAKSNFDLADTFIYMGKALCNLGEYDGAIVAYKEALDICTTMSAQDPLQYNKVMAVTLLNYGIALQKSKQVSEAGIVNKQAVSLCRDLARAGNECTDLLCTALHNYGCSCYLLGQHAEAVIAYQESIRLLRALAAANPNEEKELIPALHDIANSFHALGKHADANAAANEVLERNHGSVLEDCDYAPDFKACFVCQKAMMTASIGDPPSPLPFFPTSSSPRPAEHHGACAAHTRGGTSTSSHMPPTNSTRRLGPDQPGAAPEAPVPVHLDPTAPSPSCPPANQPHFQRPKNPSTRTPKHTGETVKVSVHRKKHKALRSSRGNRRNKRQ